MQIISDRLETSFSEIPDIKHDKFVRWGRNKKFYARLYDDIVYFGDFSTGETHRVNLNPDRPYIKKTKEEVDKWLLSMEQDNINRANYIQDRWNNLTDDGSVSGYLVSKKIQKPSLCKVLYGTLYIPYFNFKYGLCGIQQIDEHKKMFIKSSIISHSFSVFGRKLNEVKNIFITEGVATALSALDALQNIYKDNNITTVACGSINNLVYAYTSLKLRYPNINIYFIADDDEISITTAKSNQIPFFLVPSVLFGYKINGFDINDAMNKDKQKTIIELERQVLLWT